MSIPKLALTIPEAAQATGVTERTVRAWIANGDLKAHRQTRKKGERNQLTNDGTGKTVILVSDLEECLRNLPAA